MFFESFDAHRHFLRQLKVPIMGTIEHREKPLSFALKSISNLFIDMPNMMEILTNTLVSRSTLISLSVHVSCFPQLSFSRSLFHKRSYICGKIASRCARHWK